MNKNNSFIIQFICLGVVFLAILTQSFTQWIKMKPLSGFTKEIEAKELSFKTYYDGSYQDYLTAYAKENTGFREFFIRHYNQIAYTVFHHITNENIKEGLHRELYMNMYLDDFTGEKIRQNYIDVERAKTIAQTRVKETLTLIETLKQHGTQFLFVFCPTKTAVYPENTPKRYRDAMADFSLEEYYIQLFKENNIPHIDFYNYFKTIKDTVAHPLFTKTGSHWAESTIPWVADSIFRKLESLTGFNLPSIEYVSDNASTDYSPIDGELEANLNLLFPIPKPAVPNPIFTLKDTTGKDRPNLLVTADSFFNQLRRSCFVEAFNHWDYWVYNRDIHSSRSQFNWKSLDMVLGSDHVLEEADIVMAVYTAPMLYDFMFNFNEIAQNLYEKGVISEEAGIKAVSALIRENPDWMKAVETQAERLGITVEDNLVNNAQHFLEERIRNKKSVEQP